MITPAEAKKLLAEIQENRARLEGCEGPHHFVDFDVTKWPRRMRCTKCNGLLSYADVIWYMRGVEHGRAEAFRKLTKPE